MTSAHTQYAHGGELVARSLAAQGVRAIYTLCGGHVAPIYDLSLIHISEPTRPY